MESVYLPIDDKIVELKGFQLHMYLYNQDLTVIHRRRGEEDSLHWDYIPYLGDTMLIIY